MIRFFSNVLIVIFVALVTRSAIGQTVSVGIVAGVSPTSGFPNETTLHPGPIPVYTRYSSDAGDYLIGVIVEARLAWNFSIEADGIYRPLNFKAASSSIQTSSSLKNTVLSWTFPVWLKRRFPNAFLRLTPLLEPVPRFGPVEIETTRNFPRTGLLREWASKLESFDCALLR